MQARFSYSANVQIAFDSVIHICRDVNYGWLIRTSPRFTRATNKIRLHFAIFSPKYVNYFSKRLYKILKSTSVYFCLKKKTFWGNKQLFNYICLQKIILAINTFFRCKILIVNLRLAEKWIIGAYILLWCFLSFTINAAVAQSLQTTYRRLIP